MLGYRPLSSLPLSALVPAAPPSGTTGYAYYNLLRRLNEMSVFFQSEATAAARRFHLYLVDATDGITPETGEAAGQPQVSKNGGAWANTTATLTAIGNGAYYVELTATELNTLGGVGVRYKSANTAEFFGQGRVILQPLSSTTMGRTLDVTATGEAGIDWANIGGITTPQDLSNTQVAVVNALGADAIRTNSFQAGTIAPTGFINNLTFAGGAIDAAAIATDAITAAKIAADAIGSSELAASAVTEIAAAISIPSAATIADAVWDEALAGHLTAGSTGEALNGAGGGGTPPTAADIAEEVWNTVLIDHLIPGSTGEALDAAGGSSGLTVQNIVDGVWNALAVDYTIDGSMGENLQTLADAVLIWPTPVGGGTTALTLIQRAMTIADVHDNFVSEAEWLRWLNQEQYALRLFMARAGWTLPFDTTTATITSTGWSLVTDGASAAEVARTAAGHYVFTPTLADVMAIVSIHELNSGAFRRLSFNNAVDFLRQSINGTTFTGHATDYRLRMYGNEVHADFFPTPAQSETYVITYLSAPVPLTTTAQAIALPMGWEERLVLGMAQRALIKEESDPSGVEKLMKDMDSQIEQLCWNRVMSESARVRNTDPNLAIPDWQLWYWL